MNDTNLMTYILGSIAVMLLLALILIFLFNFSQRKITQTQLKMQALELSIQKELLENTVTTQETERDRIAKELHDDVASQLNIIHLNLFVLKQQLTDASESRGLVQQIETSLRESTERVRTISHELMLPLFKKMTIQQLLEQLAESINDTELLEFKLVDAHLLQLKNHFKMLHVYRIVQELANNTLKYAQAQQIVLSFQGLEPQQIRMVYSDDGRGFDPTTTQKGAGLSNLETRIRLLNGKLQLESATGNGVCFTFIFPNYD